MCEVVNIKTVTHSDENHVYIGRPSKWGNPFSHKEEFGEHKVTTRREAVRRYEEYLLSRPDLMEALHELKGKVLCCWCKPKQCHGDVLKKYVDRLEAGVPPTLF